MFKLILKIKKHIMSLELQKKQTSTIKHYHEINIIEAPVSEIHSINLELFLLCNSLD